VYPHWSRLTEALKTGEPQSGERAAGHYSALYRDPAALRSLAQGMTGGTLPVAVALAGKFPWNQYRSLVDIGTAQGCLPVTIVEAHPRLAAAGFDLPPLQPLFEAYVREHRLSERVRFFPGDFLTDVLPSAEVLVLGRVLHNWDLTTKRLLLRKAFEAIPSGGALIVYERLIDNERRTNAAALLASLNMLIMTAGGFDFTARDCIGWMSDAGFRDMRVEPLTAELSMIVAAK
jgi:O-methyltransferase